MCFVFSVEGSGVGELDSSPVSAIIARYLGIDLSHEVQVARNRRGIVVIVHGPPKSGLYMHSLVLF